MWVNSIFVATGAWWPERDRPILILGLLLLLIFGNGTIEATAQDRVLHGLNPEKRLTQYVFETWGREDGLSSNSISDLAQTPDGYLWLATGGGLVRFGGVRFTTFNSLNTDAFTVDHIRSLARGQDGSLWIGSADGNLLRFDGSRFESLVAPDSVLQNGILSLFEDSSGFLWMLSEQEGVQRFRYEAGGLIEVTLPAALAAAPTLRPVVTRRAFFEDSHGVLWIATQGQGIYALNGDSLTILTTADGLNDDFVQTIVSDQDGTVWVATDAGLNRYRDGEIQDFSRAFGLHGTAIVSLLIDEDRALWIGERGVYRVHEGQAERYESLSGHWDPSLYQDQEGSLWVGSANRGLSRFRDDVITAFGTEEGLSSEISWAVYEDRAENLWVGTSMGGFNRIKEGVVTSYTASDGLPHERVWSVQEASTRDDELWLGTDGGLVRFRDGVFTTYTTENGLSSNRVRAVYEDPEEPGAFWLGTIDGGVNYFKGGAFTHLSTKDGLAHSNVRWFHKDKTGALWIGGTNGLNRLVEGELRTFTKQDGLLSTVTRAAYEDSDGTLWIGTTGGGLSRFRNGQFVSYTKKDGLPYNDAWWILEDDQKYLWMSSASGIYKVQRRDFDDYDAGVIPALRAEDFALNPLVERVECCSAGGFPAGWKGRDGRLWFTGRSGLVGIDPRLQEPALPPTVIESMIVNGASIDLSERTEVPPGPHTIEIEYTTPYLFSPDKLRFHYQLEEYDEQVVDAGSRRTAYYSNVAPGTYQFQVSAASGDQVSGEQVQSITLAVLPSWWQTWWFRALAMLVMVVVIIAGHRLSVRAIEARNRTLKKEISARKQAEAEREAFIRELEAQKAELERYAYSVSHELKSPLVTINNFLGALEHNASTGKTERLRRDVGHIRTAVDQMGHYLNDLLELSRIGRLVNPPEAVALSDLAHEALDLVAKDRTLQGVQIDIGSAMPVVVGDRIRLLEVYQNLLHNALKFTHEQLDPHIEIGAQKNGKDVLCFVKDNGQGIPPQYHEKVFALFEQLDHHIEGSGTGLTLVKQIVEVHGGRIWVESKGEGQGSTFYFTLPIQSVADVSE